MKLVKEHINFERGLTPKESMEIGLGDKIYCLPGTILQAKYDFTHVNYIHLRTAGKNQWKTLEKEEYIIVIQGHIGEKDPTGRPVEPFYSLWVAIEQTLEKAKKIQNKISNNTHLEHSALYKKFENNSTVFQFPIRNLKRWFLYETN